MNLKIQNDKQEVQAGPGQAGAAVRAYAVKCGMHCALVFQHCSKRENNSTRLIQQNFR